MNIAEYVNASAAEKKRQTVAEPIKGKLVLGTLINAEKIQHRVVYVTGKRQARTVAEAYGYKPWNF